MLDYINKILPQACRVFEISNFSRVEDLGRLYFSPGHEPKGKVILPGMVQKRFFRDMVQQVLKFLQRFCDCDLASTFIPVYKIAKPR